MPANPGINRGKAHPVAQDRHNNLPKCFCRPVGDLVGFGVLDNGQHRPAQSPERQRRSGARAQGHLNLSRAEILQGRQPFALNISDSFEPPDRRHDHVQDMRLHGLGRLHRPQPGFKLREVNQQGPGVVILVGPGTALAGWPGNLVDDGLQIRARRKRHPDLEKEPVQLRLGQRIGAFLFNGVLRRDHEERRSDLDVKGARGQCLPDGQNGRQGMRFAKHRDLIFGHGLQHCGLGLGRGSVDLVRQQDVGKHRPFLEHQPVGVVRVRKQRAGNVRRHQIRGELNAPPRLFRRPAKRHLTHTHGA